jgi:hypothetical protein
MAAYPQPNQQDLANPFKVPCRTRLWVVYGGECFPRMLRCMISYRHGNGKPCIWGWSIWKRNSGYRALGQDLAGWIEKERERTGDRMMYFFRDPDKALEFMRLLMTMKITNEQ